MYHTKEVIRAGKFLVNQIKKGWTAEEALIQTQGSYGNTVYYLLLSSLRRVFSK